MAFEVTLSQAKTMVTDCFFAKLVPMVTGSPGMGKSAIMAAIAEELNLKLIDIRLAQCDPTDLLGFPSEDPKTGKAFYRPMDLFPLEGDPIPDGYSGWLVFMDELNGADKDVQKACYKTIYDQKVGNTPIHKNCVIAGAGNLETDNAAVEEMSTALQSRMIHIVTVASLNEWLDWSSKAGIDYRVRAYVRFKPENFYNFNPDHDDKTFACGRTWEFASRLIKNKARLSITDRALIAGTVGEGVGREFSGFCDIIDQLPTIESIEANPQVAKVPEEPSVQWATSGMLGAHMSYDNADRVMQYVSRLPEKEFQIFTLRDAVRRTEKLMEHPAVVDWIAANATELF